MQSGPAETFADAFPMLAQYMRDKERKDRDHEKTLDVVGAADTFVARSGSVTEYHKLVEAVKKWRGINGEESAKTDASI